ncbi:MAG: kdpD 3 [Firmicutes bacterium]|nr:kdpD 3 [Bacillota bacterium]
MATGMQEQRPNPDILLERLNKEARGKLTVFLGAAAGVGKTFTMLEAAHQSLAEGVDVVIGWVETHGRQETERLVTGLPRVSPQQLEYRGRIMDEMDIDAILQRMPSLVLVDELAHTNIPGARHVRRFQDVEELLQAGIDVYTTLNIQHIESLNDIVAKITGVVVKETVPDQFLENADRIQLIDIPADELIKRLKEGKVYIPGQAEQALKKFFRPGNIGALRELALRFTASRVDKDLHEYMREHHIEGPWPAAERVMVCVSASPFSAQLIRAAHRLAGGLHAELIAAHIEVPTHRFPVGDKERDRVARNMRLAEELGAKTITIIGDNLVQEILEAVRNHNVSSVVIGKPRPSRFWELWQSSTVEKLILNSAGINVYVIQGTVEQDKASSIKTMPRVNRPIWSQYVMGFLMTALVTLFGTIFRDNMELVNIALLYQIPVTMSAFWWGRWPSYFTALCGVAAFDFLYVPPIFTFNVTDIRYLWSFITFLIVAFVIGGRTDYLRAEAAAARQRERSTRALYEFSRDIAAIIDIAVITQGLVKQAADTIGQSVIALLPDTNGKLTVRAEHSTVSANFSSLIDSSELAVATWAYEHRQPAGRSTDTLPSAKLLYIPLKTNDNVFGVMGIYLANEQVSPEEKRLINAWVSLAGLAIERGRLAEQARETTLLAESERLRTALFNSISHELRTPLSLIIGSVSSLVEDGEVYSEKARRELLENIQEGASRMERVISNLLDSARLESGMMQLKIDWCDIQDIIGAALQRLRERIQQYQLDIAVNEDIPLLKADCVLLELVVINLVDNAMKYSDKKSVISITAEMEGDQILVSVLDNGVGIPSEDLAKVFDKFYRIQQPKQVSGTGLGLSICRGIIEAHGGVIWAEKRANGGTIIRFKLPLATGQKNYIDRGRE